MKTKDNSTHKRNKNILTIILVVLCIILIILLITKYKQYQNAKNTPIKTENVQSNQIISQNSASQEESQEEVTPENPFISVLADYNPRNDDSQELHQEISLIIDKEYNNDYLLAQDDILEALDKHNLDYEENASLFLPKYPAKYHRINDIPQHNVPLILQKDIRWRNDIYGNSSEDTIGDAGCAITTLAMVHSYFSGEKVTPNDIIDWSGTDYWVDSQGTSWSIFDGFAYNFGYTMTNYGNDFYSAVNTLDEGHLVVASMSPGFFTRLGHFLVIRGYDPENGYVFVNDANDNPEKMYSIQAVREEVFLKEALNYWSFYK